MIKIFYHKIDSIWSEEKRLAYLSLLPLQFQNNIITYQSRKEQQARIIGKLLLQLGLEAFNANKSLSNIEYNIHNKPFINGDIQFNITHSQDLIVVAVSNNGAIGIDAAFISEIDFSEMDIFFTKAEWENLQKNNFTHNLFYDYWTRKEAILKATGQAVFGKFNTTEVINNSVKLDGKIFFIHPITIDKAYKVCCVSTSSKPNFSIFKINAENLKNRFL